jgi:hypothetical protein
MRDPYDVLGVARGASFEEIRAAYRRASKSRHPDMGGSHEQMVELNTAYAFILSELKQSQGTGNKTEKPFEETRARADAHQRESSVDVDEELESLRRAAEALDERLRTMRQHAWSAGDRIGWAKLTWEDLARFFGNLARGGVKGLATLFAALIGVGSILVEANFVSALVILGSGVGLLLSHTLKSDKGGFMSAGLLLFGVATLWVPALRAALLGWPLATISLLICLALIFKFTREGGITGLMTGGVLALFVIGAILDDPQRRHGQPVEAERQPPVFAPLIRQPPAPSSPQATPPPPPIQREQQAARPAPPPPPAPKPEPRELRAAQGSILKFVAGVPYQLKVRSGFKTKIVANSGTVAFFRGDAQDGACVAKLELSPSAATTPYLDIDRLLRACGDSAVFQVVEVR